MAVDVSNLVIFVVLFALICCLKIDCSSANRGGGGGGGGGGGTSSKLSFNAGFGDIRLSGTCEGAVEIYGTGRTTGISSFGRLCDRYFGDREARVVCRQLGCNPVGARRTTGR